MVKKQKTAKLIKTLTGFTGVAKLYKVSPAIEGYSGEKYKHVIVSATVAMFSGPETYIFGATEEGEIADWSELPGSIRGSFSHEEALNEAGYQICS